MLYFCFNRTHVSPPYPMDRRYQRHVLVALLILVSYVLWCSVDGGESGYARLRNAAPVVEEEEEGELSMRGLEAANATLGVRNNCPTMEGYRG